MRYQFGETTVEILSYAQRVITTFYDGSSLVACPEDNDEYRARAASLGYTDPDATWQMCHAHELTHTALAHELGLKHSPALWHAAHPELPFNAELIDYEERIVLALQKKAMEAK